jgi:O-antigen/teichoic acid export membrane protein
MFTTAIVMGRQAVRWYAAINAAYPIATTLLLVLILGGFGPSVTGAVVVYLIVTTIQSVGFAIGAMHVSAANRLGHPVSYRELLGYGLPYYPASLADFFNYRVDVYLIAFLIADASAALGFYSMAVGLAEMVFIFPGAVSTLFFPHVAGSPREESDRQVALVSRVALLATGAVALLLIPAAAIMIRLILPAFAPSLPPLLVLLPGVVALSAAKVAGSYLTGIGRPGITSSVSVISLAVNIVANLVLIPRFGIIGASAASLVSYSLSSLLLTVAAARLTGTPVAGFWIPRVSDVRFAVTMTVGLLRRVWSTSRAVPGDRGG